METATQAPTVCPVQAVSDYMRDTHKYTVIPVWNPDKTSTECINPNAYKLGGWTYHTLKQPGIIIALSTSDLYYTNNREVGVATDFYHNQHKQFTLAALVVDEWTRMHGVGTAVMEELCEAADALKYDIMLECCPIGLPKRQSKHKEAVRLSKWYETFGFVRIDPKDHRIMKRVHK